MEKEYTITATADYIEYEKWANEGGDSYWKEKIERNQDQLAMCKKWVGKTIKLSDIHSLVEEVGDVIISANKVEIYNDYRE